MCDDIEEDLQESMGQHIHLHEKNDEIAEEAIIESEHLQVRENIENPFRKIICFWIGVILAICIVTILLFLIYEIRQYFPHHISNDNTKITINY